MSFPLPNGNTPGHPGYFQPSSSQGENGGQFARQHVSSGNQIPLTIIAPRPSNPDERGAVQAMNVMMGQGSTGTAYGIPGFAPDGQPYTSRDLPPRMRQHHVRQGISFDGGLMTPKTEMFTGNFAESPSHPLFQHRQSTAENDNGIDVTYAGFQPDWSQSSPSSATVPTGYLDLPTNVISPTVNDTPAQFWTDPTIQALFAAQVDHLPQKTWQAAAQDKRHHEYATFLPQQASQGYQRLDETLLPFTPAEATLKTDMSGMRGNGKHRAVFRCI